VPALALAHAELVTATPVPGSIVKVAPTELVATFTEALDGSKSSLEVRDASGAAVASGGADILAADEVTMTLPLPALANGTYEVRWTAAAQDGHIERGTYEFTVSVRRRRRAEPSPSPSPSPLSSNAPSRVAEPSATPSPGHAGVQPS
jgi:methionine-rich copper-binding protein CopC